MLLMILAYSWAIIIMALMLMQPPSQMKEWTVIGIDKIGHFGVFGIMSFLFMMAYESKNIKSLFWVVFLGVSLYSFTLECLQTLPITKRDFDILDIIANIIGSFAGAAIYILFKSFMYD